MATQSHIMLNLGGFGDTFLLGTLFIFSGPLGIPVFLFLLFTLTYVPHQLGALVVDEFCIAPKFFYAVKFAFICLENMHNNIDKIKQNPFSMFKPFFMPGFLFQC